MADKRLDQENVLNDFDYALIVKGNDVAKISKADLAAVVGELMRMRHLRVSLKSGEKTQVQIYVCAGFLYDVSNYDSSAVFCKSYARLSLINDSLNGHYKISINGMYLTIENTGGQESNVNLFLIGY